MQGEHHASHSDCAVYLTAAVRDTLAERLPAVSSTSTATVTCRHTPRNVSTGCCVGCASTDRPVDRACSQPFPLSPAGCALSLPSIRPAG
eukprot:2713337-Rhodomonas_salina.1